MKGAQSQGRLGPDRRYELLECIGRGATGAVYRAREARADSEREVCVKRLSAEVGPEHGRLLREEGRLLAQVRHANLVSLLDVGEDEDGTPFLVLELVEGTDLGALCRRLAGVSEAKGYLPDSVAVFVACALLRALAAVQRSLPGLVHRDVTPQNVLVSTEGEVKLTDFGIALAVDRVRWTRPSLVKGKLGYMAPEQIRGELLDVRTDLYAVGVILYELLSRRRPAAPHRGMAELHAVQDGDIHPLHLHRPDLDRSLLRAVDRLVSSSDRPPSADDALRTLAAWSAGELGSLRLASIVRSVTEETR